MPKVIIRDDESLDQALRRFNRELLREGVIKEIRSREFYQKPSTIRKNQKIEQEKRFRREKRYNR